MVVESGCLTAERCAERFPGSINRITEIRDTMIVRSSKTFDTIVSFGSRDTVFIQDRLTDVKVKIIRLPGDSIFIEPVCPPDTIRIEKIRIETTEERMINLIKSNGKDFFLIVFILCVALVAFSYFIQSIKK